MEAFVGWNKNIGKIGLVFWVLSSSFRRICIFSYVLYGDSNCHRCHGSSKCHMVLFPFYEVISQKIFNFTDDGFPKCKISERRTIAESTLFILLFHSINQRFNYCTGERQARLYHPCYPPCPAWPNRWTFARASLMIIMMMVMMP